MGSEAYKNSGVDTDAGQAFVDAIKPYAKRASRPEVVSDVGGFAGMFAMRSNWKHPVLVSGADGVGTKLAIAKMAQKFNTKYNNTNARANRFLKCFCFGCNSYF